MVVSALRRPVSFLRRSPHIVRAPTAEAVYPTPHWPFHSETVTAEERIDPFPTGMHDNCRSIRRAYDTSPPTTLVYHPGRSCAPTLPIQNHNVSGWELPAQRIKIKMIAGGDHTVMYMTHPYGGVRDLPHRRRGRPSGGPDPQKRNIGQGGAPPLQEAFSLSFPAGLLYSKIFAILSY